MKLERLPSSISMFYNKVLNQGFREGEASIPVGKFNERASTLYFTHKELTKVKIDMNKLGFLKYNSKDNNAVVEKKLKGLFG